MVSNNRRYKRLYKVEIYLWNVFELVKLSRFNLCNWLLIGYQKEL